MRDTFFAPQGQTEGSQWQAASRSELRRQWIRRPDATRPEGARELLPVSHDASRPCGARKLNVIRSSGGARSLALTRLPLATFYLPLRGEEPFTHWVKQRS